GLDGVTLADPTVSVPVRRSNRFIGVTVHQLTDLHNDHTTTVFGMTATSGARTIIDLAATKLTAYRLAATIHQAVRMGLTTHDEIAEFLDSLARKGKPGVRKLRSVLAPRLGREHVGDSVLESRLFDVIVDAGLPSPTTQFRPPWLRKVYGRVD